MAEKEYIERSKAIEAIDDACGELNYSAVEEYNIRVGGISDGMGTAIEIIEAIPAADVRPVKWIPVTERLPKYGERVLVFGGFTMYVAYYDKNRYGGESWHKLNSKSHYCNPTHWMPLPQPPKEG